MKINDVTSYDLEGGVAVVTVNSPPVNALSAAVRQGLELATKTAMADDAVKAMVIICEGRVLRRRRHHRVWQAAGVSGPA
ncbi:MAG: hypothetical protein R3C40_09200 [Parvularculaceae bacterium]